MRLAHVLSLLVLTECGGSHKPAESPAETGSLENGSAEQATSPTGDSSTRPAQPVGSASGGSDKSTPEAEAVAPGHPEPAVTGTIDGKPFAPKAARLSAKMHKDGRVVLALDESVDCTPSGSATLTMTVPWEEGYKVDLGSLKRASTKGAGEISFSRAGARGKKEISKTFKPSGTVTIVKAPTTENAVGKMKIDLQSGDYMLAGDLDVQVCVAPK